MLSWCKFQGQCLIPLHFLGERIQAKASDPLIAIAPNNTKTTSKVPSGCISDIESSTRSPAKGGANRIGMLSPTNKAIPNAA